MIKRSFSSYQKAFTVADINQHLIKAEYAVRGKIPTLAGKISEDLKNGSTDYKFDKVAQLNIGNPQIFNQPPIHLMREVVGRTLMGGAVASQLQEDENKRNLMALYHMQAFESKSHEKNIKRLSDAYLKQINTSAYPERGGYAFVRESTKRFIEKRDGVEADLDNIFIINGAGVGIKFALEFLIDCSDCGVMIPIPQYPLYSALLTLFNGRQIQYFLNEEDNWNVTYDELQESLSKAVDQGTKPRAIVVINPGNPTGNVLKRERMEEIIRFAYENDICILADEVYQENIYGDNEWFSFKKVLKEMDDERVRNETPLISFHSMSKGIFGECGMRGGYMEIVNFKEEHMERIRTKMNYFFANIGGQLALDFKNRYLSGELREELDSEVFESLDENYNRLKRSLEFRAQQASMYLNNMKNVKSNSINGAMYAFPSLFLPDRFKQEAESKGLVPDAHYCIELLENTGICTVPGSGFLQKEGTNHLRVTILPQPDDYFVDVFKQFKKFNDKLMEKYE